MAKEGFPVSPGLSFTEVDAEMNAKDAACKALRRTCSACTGGAFSTNRDLVDTLDFARFSRASEAARDNMMAR